MSMCWAMSGVMMPLTSKVNACSGLANGKLPLAWWISSISSGGLPAAGVSEQGQEDLPVTAPGPAAPCRVSQIAEYLLPEVSRSLWLYRAQIIQFWAGHRRGLQLRACPAVCWGSFS
jgi:hypothetical protein